MEMHEDLSYSLFRVVTLNILHDPPHLTWSRRAPLVEAGLIALQPDIVLLQEVAWPDEQATSLAAALQVGAGRDFRAYITGLFATTGWQEGLTILSWFPCLDTSELEFPGAEKFCQRARFVINGETVDGYNSHLDPYSATRRQQQITMALEWTTEFGDADAVIFGGDLNGIPSSIEIAPLQRNFRSAYEVAMGKDPDRIIDYLWASRSLDVVHAGLSLDQSDRDDPSLYPSDHLALHADFRMKREDLDSMKID